MPGNRRLWWLVAAHLALGVTAGVLAPVEVRSSWLRRMFPPAGLDLILIVPLFAVALSQALLIALWGTVSTAAPGKQLARLVVGVVYLEALFSSELRGEFRGLSTVTVVLFTVSLLVGRALGIRVTRRGGSDQGPRTEAEGLRFSIRGLMLLTVVVALLSSGARLLRATPAHFFLVVVVWSVCFVVVGLVALWVALGTARPPRRVPALFVLSPVLGAFFAYAVHAHEAGQVYITLTMLLYPTVLLGSLLVVRSCGYRLVRRAAASAEPADGDGPGPLARSADEVSLPR